MDLHKSYAHILILTGNSLMITPFISKTVRRIIFFLLAAFTKKMNGSLNFLRKDYAEVKDKVETYFLTSSGIKIPVYPHYRYSIKECWRAIPGLDALDVFSRKGRIPENHRKKLDNIISSRTVNLSLQEIDDFVSEVLSKYKDQFLIFNRKKSKYIIKPDMKLINEEIEKFTHHHESMFDKINAFGIDVCFKRRDILEIGFISGGYSLFGFEKLGMSVHGVDNCYDGTESSLIELPHYIKEKVQGDVCFQYGDITKKTQYIENSFDYIYSSSVLEHIKDLDGAFREMRRILKKDGLLIHSYNPFFAVNGGHALGITDSPWGHLRLSDTDYRRYINELRPNEIPLAHEWIETALNRVTISQMQHCLVKAGFKILLWQETASARDQLDFLTADLAQEIFENYPGLSISDLTAKTIFFVAGK